MVYAGTSSGGVFLNGERQKKTFNDQSNPATKLIARKSGKKIAPGETVTLQVRMEMAVCLINSVSPGQFNFCLKNHRRSSIETA